MVTRTSRLSEPVSFPKDDSQWFSFLHGNVEFALKAKEYIDNLAPTAATFKSKHLPDAQIQAQRKVKIMKLLGAWKAPESMFREGDTYVNPHSTHAHHYSDAVVECGCGVPVLRLSFGANLPQPTNHQEHAGGCDLIDKTEARLQLLKNWREIIREQYKYNHSLRSSAQRLGYEKSDDINFDRVYRLGIDVHELERESRRRLARTCIVLSREHSNGKIGEIFGVKNDAIGRMIRKETTADARALYRARL